MKFWMKSYQPLERLGERDSRKENRKREKTLRWTKMIFQEPTEGQVYLGDPQFHMELSSAVKKSRMQ